MISPADRSYRALLAVPSLPRILGSMAIARIGNLLSRPAIRRMLDGITGAVLIGLGLRLAAEDR